MPYPRRLLFLILVLGVLNVSAQPVDCSGVPGGSALPGTACDDGDEGTLNDAWSPDCVCSGTVVDCSTATLITLLPEGVEVVDGTSPFGPYSMWYALELPVCADVKLHLCEGSNITGYAPLLYPVCPADPDSAIYATAEVNGCGGSNAVFNCAGAGLHYIFLTAGEGAFSFTLRVEPCNGPWPLAMAYMGEPSPALVCQGEAVDFDASASTAGPGHAIAGYQWIFGDGIVDSLTGPEVSHTYWGPVEHQASLIVTDDKGCMDTLAAPLLVWVSTTPDFSGTGLIGPACSGDTIALVATVEPRPSPGLDHFAVQTDTFIPDFGEGSLNIQLEISSFGPGEIVSSMDELQGICLEMEHSFMGDLAIQLACPGGQSVILHEQGGGGTFLGEPVDDDDQPQAVGTCYSYCWSPTATNGTWTENSGNGSLPTGVYQSANPMSALLGCPLNGTWSLAIYDLWAGDNGYLCGWGLDLIDGYLPHPGLSTIDSAYWSGNGAVVDPADPLAAEVHVDFSGIEVFTFAVMDDFGCVYDTAITVAVPDLELGFIMGPQLIGTGGPVTYSVEPVLQDGDSIVWSLPPGWIWDDPQPTDAEAYFIVPDQNGMFTICATAFGDGCSGIPVCFYGEVLVGLAEQELPKPALFPNPTEGMLLVTRPSNMESTIATLFDTIGHHVLMARLWGASTMLDLSSLTTGSYELRWTDRSGTQRHRVVIAR